MRWLAIVTLVLGIALAATAAAATGGTAAGPRHTHATHGLAASAVQPLAAQLARGRLATAKYATSLARAKANGYGIITRMIPDMGYHYLNPKVTGFDVRKPPILVYAKQGSGWQLVAFEWVFPEKPKQVPLPGATYGSFGAACHYKDGTFAFVAAETDCTPKSPETGAGFGFWHPDLVTLHVWLWYPNPDGVYAGKNSLMRPFNSG
jgi:hypothetical protein